MAKGIKEKTKGVIVITCISPHRIPASVLHSVAAAQGRAPGIWPLVTFHNKNYKEPKNLKEKKTFIAENLNKARLCVLAQGYDWMLKIDSDIIIPKNTIPELLASEADIAVGLYRLRYKPYNLSPWIEEPVGSGKIRLLKDEELKQRFIEVHRFGLGCTLIKGDVLKRVSFNPALDSGPDYDFARRCVDEGFKIIACTRVKCGHLDNGKVIGV